MKEKNSSSGAIDWQEVFDAIPDMIAIIDPDHRILKANKAMADKLGCSSEDAVGCRCFEVVHGLQAVPDFCPHARTLISKKEENGEVVEKCIGGIFDVTTTPLFDEKGNVTCSIHVARDITHRKNKERLMMENMALGEFALNHSLDDLLRLAIDKAELLTGSSLGFFHFLGDDEQTILFHSWSAITMQYVELTDQEHGPLPVEQSGGWADCVRERRPVIHNDHSTILQWPGITDSKMLITRDLLVPVVRGEKVVAIMGAGNKATAYDETDVEIISQLTNLTWDYVVSKRFEEALRKSEQYARALLDAVPDLIFRMNRDGVYLDYKAASEDLYFQASSIIGKNNRNITPREFSEMIESKIFLTLETMQMVIFEYQLPIPGKGLRDFEARMVPSGTDEVISISRDITERKKTEKSLKKKIEELEWFNHMMIDRELKMIELKREINELLRKSGEEEKYTVHQ